MFDLSSYAAEYDDALARCLPPLCFALCDRRVLVPLERLPEFVRDDTGEVLAPERTATLVEAGWFPALPGPDGTLGFPFYVPGRVGLFLKLERAGWSAAELAAAAEAEEGLIDTELVAPDMPYEDDDLLLLRAGLAAEIALLANELGFYEEPRHGQWAHRIPPDLSADAIRALLDERRARDAWLASSTWDDLDADDQARFARQAFLLRARHETVRMLILEREREFLAAGYSFFVFMRHMNRNSARTPRWQFDRVLWPETLTRLDAVSGAEVMLPIRLPGLIIEGDRVIPTERMTPPQYQATWERHDLDGWVAAVEARAGRRVCERCLAALPPEAKPSRRFCSAACRNAEKAEAYRRRHPDRVKRAQQGWRSS